MYLRPLSIYFVNKYQSQNWQNKIYSKEYFALMWSKPFWKSILFYWYSFYNLNNNKKIKNKKSKD